ncbi:alpha/beta hydrolase [Agrilutibacter solisilvae]|uniref:Alpha/beta fold hydrolase n=1 Tax=Agrilutibacter solisilvae TaxID=2763317 RepID=A0A974XWE9_9GAMM|nr:alpha/beta fold hydrolase [Lysobacter solisilvae]QSX77126.1 alpha/beta fold hydrolase [Lysobacter solisilvae]
MRKANTALLALALALALIPAGGAAAAPASVAAQDGAPATTRAVATPATQAALRLLDQLDAGRFDAATASFSAQMRAAVPADKLRHVWESLPAQAGVAQGRGTPRERIESGMVVVEIPLDHATVDLLATVAIDEQGRVAGFLIQPAPPPPPPAPAADASYIERDLPVGAGARALPATLTLPRGDGPFPAIVLVHGSGPQDRDETIGANRPFLDLARGLAAHGIAVLRYDKRTRARPSDFASGITVDAEVTNDAVAAVATLRAQAQVDPARIHVLGHSQGGMLAPRIAQRAGAAGAILMAAPSRPLLDILLEQNRRLAAMDGRTTPEEEAFIAALDDQIKRLRRNEHLAPADLPLGLPATYWRELEAIDAVAEASAAKLPLLLLQGGRDIQVVEADWQRWRGAFGTDARATLKHYPALNHLGIAGTGPGSVAEYNVAGHVDAGLIDDVAAWVQAR